MTQSPSSDQTSSPSGSGLSILAQGLALAQMLAARLVHDLAGLIGTLSGTLELAADDPEALAMARETAQALQARLKLVRTAFGASEQEMLFGELRELLAAVPVSRRVALHLDSISPTRRLTAGQARLLACVAMLSLESLAGEGEAVMQENADATILVAAIGPRASWPHGFAGYLTDPDAALEHATDQGPRGILGPLVALLAPACGAQIRLLIGTHVEAAAPLLISFGK